jgi:hypothetical protein
MESISKSDRLVQLLRLRLQDEVRAKLTKSRKSSVVSRREAKSAQEISAQFAREGVEDRQLKRSIVEQLLVDRFGPGLVNDVKFQNIIFETTELMENDEEIARLFESVLNHLRRKR